jgi:cytochrome P450
MAAERTEATPLRPGPGFGQDPHPFLGSLRGSGPVHRVLLPDGTESWWVTRYDEVAACLDDHQRFSSQVHKAVESAAIQNSQALIRKDPTLRYTMINRDPPDHTRMRKLVVRAFSARRVDALRPRIEDRAQGLLDQLAGRADAVDLVKDYAFPLPVGVICDLLGVPESDSQYFGSLISRLIGAAGGQQALESIAALKDFMSEKLDEKRVHPADDVLTGMVEAADEERLLSREELPAMALQLLTAGHETSIYLISGGTLRLLQHPDQLEMLHQDPTLLPNAIDELLRFDPPPVPGVFRYATEDVDVGGTVIPKGALVILSVAAANRDPHQFPGPDELDVTRQEIEHMAFGGGIHYCLGARLARLEGEIAIGSLFRRFPGLRLAIPFEDVRWKPLNFLRGLTELPVLLQ